MTAAHPDRAGYDIAISRAYLLGAEAGSQPETLRLHVPGDEVAFGRRDVVDPRYEAAVAAARAAGFSAAERLAGGRAAVFHSGTISFSWAIPDPDPTTRTMARYEEISGIIAAALQSLGADARVGELAGEYCPGAYSVNVGGTVKVMGVGQRLSRRAAHIGGVIVVGGSDRLRQVLEAVYDALELPWEPATAGALEDGLPGVTADDVIAALVAGFRRSYEIVPGGIDPATCALADELLPDHLPDLGAGAAGR